MARFGVSRNTIANIRQGKAWAHVTGEQHRPKKRLDPEKVLAIYRDPRPYAELVEAYGTSRSNISCIKLGKTWVHVTGHKTGAKK